MSRRQHPGRHLPAGGRKAFDLTGFQQPDPDPDTLRRRSAGAESAGAEPGSARRRHVPAAAYAEGLIAGARLYLPMAQKPQALHPRPAGPAPCQAASGRPRHHGPPTQRPRADHLAEVSVRKSPASRLLGGDAGRREGGRTVHVSGR